MNFLLIALGIFVLIQIMNGVVNILTARHMRKQAILEALAKEDENRLMDEQWTSVLDELKNMDKNLSYMRESINEIDSRLFRLEYTQDEILEKISPKEKKARGPYKPRKPKMLENKKTPLAN